MKLCSATRTNAVITAGESFAELELELDTEEVTEILGGFVEGSSKDATRTNQGHEDGLAIANTIINSIFAESSVLTGTPEAKARKLVQFAFADHPPINKQITNEQITNEQIAAGMAEQVLTNLKNKTTGKWKNKHDDEFTAALTNFIVEALESHSVPEVQSTLQTADFTKFTTTYKSYMSTKFTFDLTTFAEPNAFGEVVQLGEVSNQDHYGEL